MGGNQHRKGHPDLWKKDHSSDIEKRLVMKGGEKMKAIRNYLMMILFIVLLLIGQLGCAHTSQHSSEGMTARSTEEPDFNPPPKGQGLRIAKKATKGLFVGTGMGALIGGGLGALVGLGVAGMTNGAGIILLPYLAAGGAAIGGAIGGVSGSIAGGVKNVPSPEHYGNTYDTWKGIRFVQVDSLQPVLKWKSFPTSKDIKEDKTGDLSRVSDVTYELKILRAQDSFQGDIVYTRTELQEPSHKVERPLISLTRYFWSVRVRFKLDDNYRETEWILGPPFYTTM
jgi:hypothetical protein